MTNRGAIVAAFVAGAMLVAVAVVAYGGAAPRAEMSLAEKKAALAALRHQTTQKLDRMTTYFQYQSTLACVPVLTFSLAHLAVSQLGAPVHEHRCTIAKSA